MSITNILKYTGLTTVYSRYRYNIFYLILVADIQYILIKKDMT